jgi:hypothetical protein
MSRFVRTRISDLRQYLPGAKGFAKGMIRKSEQNLVPLQPYMRLLKQDEGSFEAGLTLIPLTILFLVSAQLVFTSQWGNAQLVDQQSRTNKIAILGESDVRTPITQGGRPHEISADGSYISSSAGSSASSSASSSSNSFGRLSYEPLIGGGHLVIYEQNKPIPFLANLGEGFSNRFMYQKRSISLSEVFTE